MTLASVREYDPGQITRQAGDAVVIGAGMAGLLTARVLADSFEQVTLVEKDSLPDAPVTRKGIPQGNHIHNLHEAGRRTLENLFPGQFTYNSLWINEYTDVSLACRVDTVSEQPWGYEAVVTCTGHSNTDVPENATVTPGPHADWFTQSFRYRVSENATHRHQVDSRDPVS